MEAKGLRVAFAQPLYSQVRAQVLKRVSAGEWGAGEALPNEFALASEYQVSVGTIRRAIEGLEKEGVLVRKQGRGTFVSGNGRTPLQDKFTAVRRPGSVRGAIGYQLEGVGRRLIRDNEAAVLGRDPDSHVIEIEQIVTLDGVTVGVERSAVVADLFPRLETQLAYGQHLYPIFHLYGCLVTRASDVLSVVGAEIALACNPSLSGRGQFLRVDRVAFTHADLPVEFRVSHYDPTRVSYTTSIV